MSKTFVKNTFFCKGTLEPQRSTNLLKPSQEPDVLLESVNAIRQELDLYSIVWDMDKMNNDELESSAVIPTVQLYDSCEGMDAEDRSSNEDCPPARRVCLDSSDCILPPQKNNYEQNLRSPLREPFDGR